MENPATRRTGDLLGKYEHLTPVKRPVGERHLIEL